MTCDIHRDQVKVRLFQLAVKNQSTPTFLFRARGGSMYPTLRDGDQLEITRLKPEYLRPGEIVVFTYGDQILCHRLIRKEQRQGVWWFFTQGDFLLSPDPGFPADQYLGVVSRIHRAGVGIADLQTPSARRHHRCALRLAQLKPTRSEGRPLITAFCDWLELSRPGHALLRLVGAMVSLSFRLRFQPWPSHRCASTSAIFGEEPGQTER